MAQDKVRLDLQIENSEAANSIIVTDADGKPQFLPPTVLPKVLKSENGAVSWEDETAPSTSVDVDNTGGGEALLSLVAPNTVTAKTLVEGTNITLTSDDIAGTITIEASVDNNDTTTPENLGTGEPLLIPLSNVQAKSIKGGTNITISTDPLDDNTIIIDGTPPANGEDTNPTNRGGGEGILVLNTNVEAKSLVAGVSGNIILSSDINEITIDAVGDTTTAHNLGASGESVLIEGSNVDAKKLKEGNYISLSSDSESITITGTAPESTSVVNLGGGENILIGSSNVEAKTLIAGENVTFDVDANTITINVLGGAGIIKTALQTYTLAEFKASGFTDMVAADASKAYILYKGFIIFKNLQDAGELASFQNLYSLIDSTSQISTYNDLDSIPFTPGDDVFQVFEPYISGNTTPPNDTDAVRNRNKFNEPIRFSTFIDVSGSTTLDFDTAIVGVLYTVVNSDGSIDTSGTNDSTIVVNTGGFAAVLKDGSNVTARTLKGGQSIVVTQFDDYIQIAAPNVGDSTSAQNLTATPASKEILVTGSNVQARRLTAGANITLTQNTNDIVIAGAAGGNTTVASNAPGGVPILKTNSNIEAKSLVAGTPNVTISGTTDNVVISVTSVPANTMIRQVLANNDAIGVTTRVAVINRTTGQNTLPDASLYPTGEILYVVSEIQSTGSVKLKVVFGQKMNGKINGITNFDTHNGACFKFITNGTNTWTLLD